MLLTGPPGVASPVGGAQPTLHPDLVVESGVGGAAVGAVASTDARRRLDGPGKNTVDQRRSRTRADAAAQDAPAVARGPRVDRPLPVLRRDQVVSTSAVGDGAGGASGAPASPRVVTLDWRETVRVTDACTACGACLATCPEGALRRAPKRPLVIDSACTACWACIEICPAGAIEEALARPEVPA